MKAESAFPKWVAAGLLIVAGYIACSALVVLERGAPPRQPDVAALHAITNSPWVFGAIAVLFAATGLMILFGKPKSKGR